MRRRPGTFCAAANAALHWALGQILFRQTDRQSDQRHDDGCNRDRTRLGPRSPHETHLPNEHLLEAWPFFLTACQPLRPTPTRPSHEEANMPPPPDPTRLITSTAALPFLCIAAQVK